jgi:hypothetical protein
MSARLWLALAAGVGCGACAYAGLYPRFDEGKLRLVLALTSAPFAAAVVAYALSAKSATAAVGRTLLMASVLGIAAIVVPAAILSRHGTPEFVMSCCFGAFFGAPTGAIYGGPLALLAGEGWRHVNANTHEGTDRAARLGGLWLVVISLLATTGTLFLDAPRFDGMTESMVEPSRLPLVFAVGAACAGALVVARATLRARRRSGWIARVRAGLEPMFRVRAVDLRDPVEALPRVGAGAPREVVEWCPDELSTATSGTAYRVAAVGTAVLVVGEDENGGGRTLSA